MTDKIHTKTDQTLSRAYAFLTNPLDDDIRRHITDLIEAVDTQRKVAKTFQDCLTDTYRPHIEENTRLRQLVADLTEVLPDSTAADALLERVLLMRMHGEDAPGNTDSWHQLDQDIETHLRRNHE